MGGQRRGRLETRAARDAGGQRRGRPKTRASIDAGGQRKGRPETQTARDAGGQRRGRPEKRAAREAGGQRSGRQETRVARDAGGQRRGRPAPGQKCGRLSHIVYLHPPFPARPPDRQVVEPAEVGRNATEIDPTLIPWVKYGVRSPKFIWASCAQLYSLAETPQPPTPSFGIR